MPNLTIRWCPVRGCRAKPQTKLSNLLFQQHAYLSPSQHQAALRQAKVYKRAPKRSKAERQQLQEAPLADRITTYFKRTAALHSLVPYPLYSAYSTVDDCWLTRDHTTGRTISVRNYLSGALHLYKRLCLRVQENAVDEPLTISRRLKSADVSVAT